MAAGCSVWAKLVGVDRRTAVEDSGPQGAEVRSFSAGDVTCTRDPVTSYLIPVRLEGLM